MFAAMWTAWDWDHWIRPQIDDAAAIGNAVRLWGSTQTFLAGNITEDLYFARWQQLLDYCAKKGLLMLPSGCDLQTDVKQTISTGKAASHYATWANMLAQYPGVIGVDLLNEGWGLTVPGTGRQAEYNWLLTVLRACADAVHSQGLPVTVSFPVFDSSVWSWSSDGPAPAGPLYGKHPVDAFFELCDFLDFHIYAKTTQADIEATYEKSWARSKPMVFGEFGIALEHSTAERTDFYNMVHQLVSARSDHWGALAWSCYDVNSTDNTYGLYSAPGVLRQDIAKPFAGFPTAR
ncbi:hypothetical protein [Mycobacterium sp. SM3041]|uniref:hypothetical protein n=1 Tax=Mycobacterium sp. SM3041 TaxID=3114291 RepID=UPI003204B81E